MTQEEDQGKGRTGTKPQERRSEEELGSRQRKRKVGVMGGRKECRWGVHGTKEAATDQVLHFFQLVSGKCYVGCVVRLEINRTTQSFFYSQSQESSRQSSICKHPPISGQCGFSCSSNSRKRTASVCVCQGPPTRVLYPPRPVPLSQRTPE